MATGAAWPTTLARCRLLTPVDGSAIVGPKNVDQGYFFAGDVPVYGQQVGATTPAAGVSARATPDRRVRPADRRRAAKVGEIFSVGTLFAFNECDAEVKISGVSDRRFVSVELA